MNQPSAVRTVMDRMYANDHRYHSFSALFVDRLPGNAPDSVRIYVHQPRSGIAAIYANTTGAGRPREIRHAYGESLDRYSPAASAFTTDTRVLQPLPLPPLETMPPNVQQGDFTAVSFGDATSMNDANALADVFIQPSGLITNALFTHKAVKLAGRVSFDGRSAWLLTGSQIPTVPLEAGEPHAWRMWVDQRTGIVLRLDYLTGERTVGQAVMRNVRVDGSGVAYGGGDSFEGWTVPATARYVAPLEYGGLNSESGSGPIDWIQHHLDIVLQIGLIMALILLWWVLGRFEPGKTQTDSPTGSPSPTS